MRTRKDSGSRDPSGSKAYRSTSPSNRVRSFTPAATRPLLVDGVRGWLYPVRSQAGDDFQLFLWFDGSAYQVKVARPPASSTSRRSPSF